MGIKRLKQSLYPMKALTIAALLCALVALTQASCLAASYCKTCTNNLCASCQDNTHFFQGPQTLSNGVCINKTTAQLVPVNADKVSFYFTGLKTYTNTTIDPVTCKSGYYAFNDGVTPTQQGCYTTSSLSSAPLNLITANTPSSFTNCGITIGLYTSSHKFWSCVSCDNNYTLSNSMQQTASCASGVSITNCDKGRIDSGTTYCDVCKSGYVRNNAQTSCVAETTVTKNCDKLDSTGLLCDTCQYQSYFVGTVCVKAAFIKTIAVLLIAIMVSLL